MGKMRGIKRLGFVLAIVLTFFISGFPAEAQNLNDLYQQKENLSKDLEKYQSAADNKSQEAKTLSTQVNNLDSDIKSTENKIQDTGQQIGSTQDNISKLSSEIDIKSKELEKLKKKLNNALVEIYRFSSRSSLELLFAGGTLGEATNETKYVEAIELQVKSLYTGVQSAKNDLDKQKSEQEAKKAELDQLKERQVSYQKSAEYQKDQKGKMLNMTIEQKMSYEQMVDKLQSEISHVSADIYAARQKRLSGGAEQLVGGGSGYPYGSIDEPDAWGFLTRECTSYAAWNFNVIQGKDWYNTQPGHGSATYWDEIAHTLGYSVSSSAKVGAIISWKAGPLTSGWGHVAIVEAVHSDGTIDVSEYNWIKYSYSYRKNVTPGDYGSYSYIY